jgi:hypothetical protein
MPERSCRCADPLLPCLHAHPPLRKVVVVKKRRRVIVKEATMLAGARRRRVRLLLRGAMCWRSSLPCSVKEPVLGGAVWWRTPLL